MDTIRNWTQALWAQVRHLNHWATDAAYVAEADVRNVKIKKEDFSDCSKWRDGSVSSMRTGHWWCHGRVLMLPIISCYGPPRMSWKRTIMTAWFKMFHHSALRARQGRHYCENKTNPAAAQTFSTEWVYTWSLNVWSYSYPVQHCTVETGLWTSNFCSICWSLCRLWFSEQTCTLATADKAWYPGQDS